MQHLVIAALWVFGGLASAVGVVGLGYYAIAYLRLKWERRRQL
jgi:hypothetical protein